MAQTKINKRAAKVFTALHGWVYKATGGRLGGKMSGGEIIVLGTTGRKSGKLRERPLIGGHHPDGWVVIASYSGHDEHPAWYLNLQADPKAMVRAGNETHAVVARELEGEERQQLWDQMVTTYGDYAEYQKVTDREIPVLVLARTD